MRSTRPLHDKSNLTVRPAAFVLGGGRRVRPAFSAEGEPVVEEAFGHDLSDESAEGPAGEHRLDADDDQAMADHAMGHDDSLLGEEALFVDPTLEPSEVPSAPSHAESVQMPPSEGDADPADAGADLGALIEALTGTQAALTEEAKATAVTLGLAIAKRVVGDQVAVDPSSLRLFIEEALERSPSSGRVRLYLSPADMERMEELESERWHEPGREVVIVPDEELGVGDCRLEAPGVSMDGRLSSRISRLANAARSALLISEEGP